jgi:MtrB/PioB family decaheme-associated outer membrane protein
MRTTSLLVLTLALGAPLIAQDNPVTPSSPDVLASWTPQFRIRQVDLGFQVPGSDTDSSKFVEYREYHYATSPFLRFAGNERFRYDVTAWNVGQDNGRYRAMIEPGPISVTAGLDLMPHRFGADARSIVTGDGRGNFTMSDQAQLANQQAIEQMYAQNRAGVNFAFLNALVAPQLGAASPFDVQLRRDRGYVDVNFTREKPVAVHLTYLHEERNGNRGSGTAFGFGNVVETAEPIDYRTQDLGLSAEWAPSWGLLRGAFHVNDFTNRIPVQTFDNPFRSTDSTDASAYQAPGSASIAGASFARMALPPDNRAVTGSAGFTLKMGRHRLITDASLGRWTQNESFIPFSTNTAITVPFDATNPAFLPAPSLDGKIDVFSFSSTLYLRPTNNTNVTARIRRYDLDNKTPRLHFEEGYARFDGVWEEIPRINVPYGYTNDQAQVTGSVGVGKLSFEAGYKLDRWQRTFRESRKTMQHTGFASVHASPTDWAVLTATYERGKRTFDEYVFEESEEASFLDPGAPANLPELRRYDQAEKQTDRVVSMLQLSPGDKTTLSVSYAYGLDDYVKTAYGLVDSKTQAFTAEIDFTPTERVNLFGFYTREDINSFQRGRQSGATPSTREIDDWTADIKDAVDSYGLGANFTLKPETLDLQLTGTYQDVNGNADISAPDGGLPAAARAALGGIADLPRFDDTKLLSLRGELGYSMKTGWRLAVGGLLEDFELGDPFAVGSTYYTPGALFLAGDDGDYRGHVFYTRITKRW